MKHIGYHYITTAKINFSWGDLTLLRILSQRHYDSLCKSIFTPGQDAFLWGWTVRCTRSEEIPSHKDFPTEKSVVDVLNDPREVVVEATWRQLDILTKVLEEGNYLQNKTLLDHASSLFMKVGQTLAALRYATSPDLDFSDGKDPTPGKKKSANPPNAHPWEKEIS